MLASYKDIKSSLQDPTYYTGLQELIEPICEVFMQYINTFVWEWVVNEWYLFL